MTRPSRTRLLTGSLSLAVIASLVIGYAISATLGTPDSADVDSLGGASAVEPIETNKPVEGDKLPAVDLQRLDRPDVNTTDFLGKPLIINNWYSTCLPCEKELPDLALVQQEVGDRVRFIGVDIFPPSQTEERFARDRGVEYELFYDPEGALTSALGIATAPTTLFVNGDGVIVKQTGVLTATHLRELIVEVFP